MAGIISSPFLIVANYSAGLLADFGMLDQLYECTWTTAGYDQDSRKELLREAYDALHRAHTYESYTVTCVSTSPLHSTQARESPLLQPPSAVQQPAEAQEQARANPSHGPQAILFFALAIGFFGIYLTRFASFVFGAWIGVIGGF